MKAWNGALYLIFLLFIQSLNVKGVDWTEYSGSFIAGHNIGSIMTTSSLDACKQQCLQQVAPRCLSIDFTIAGNVCSMNGVRKGGGISLSSFAGLNYYEYEDTSTVSTPVTMETTTSVVTSYLMNSWCLHTRGQLPPRSPTAVATVESKLACALWCGPDKTCLAFSYTAFSRTCQLYDFADIVGGSWIQRDDTSYYCRTTQV